MKTIKNLKYMILATIVLLAISCQQEDILVPLENNKNQPGIVTNVQVENLPGKANISYTLPNDEDLLYVKAVYQTENGQNLEVKTSYYTNNMLLEGFSGQAESEVTLYAVNRSEVASEPVVIKVNPLEAPIYGVFRSLTLDPDFGGVRIKASNPEKDDVAILLMQLNEQGDWEPLQNSVYTSQEEISKGIRGFEAVEQEFAAVVRDRWQNVTDTIFKSITPLFEQAIPTSGYAGLRLDNDQPSYPENRMEYLWDGNTQYWPGVWLTLRSDASENHTFTIDLGVTAKLSRVKMWDYPEWVNGVQTWYYLGNMKHFRIWGSATAPDSSGSWDGWTLLGEYEKIKPSGLPYGQQNNEDVAQALAGFDYEFPIEAPAVRYLRVQNLENFAGGESLAVAELIVYGDPN